MAEATNDATMSDERIKQLLAEKLENGVPDDYLPVIDREDEIFEKVEGQSVLAKELTKVRLFFSLLRDYAKRDYRDVSSSAIVAIGIGLTYLVWPQDIIPDYLPGGIGFIDDAILLGLVWLMVREEIEPYVAWKAERDPAFETIRRELYGG